MSKTCDGVLLSEIAAMYDVSHDVNRNVWTSFFHYKVVTKSVTRYQFVLKCGKIFTVDTKKNYEQLKSAWEGYHE